MVPLREAVASVLVFLFRFAVFVFLRWIPGHHLVPIIGTLYITWLAQVTYCTLHKNPPRRRGLFGLLVSGLPSSSKRWAVVHVFINTLLLISVLDLTFRAEISYPSHDLSFARVGYVSHNSAKIFVREATALDQPTDLSYRLADNTNSQLDPVWTLADSVSDLSNETDFTHTFELKDLEAETRYEFHLTTKHQGFFVTAPRPGHFSARTENNGRFTFVHSSCIIPRFPYNPLMHPLAVPGFRYLGSWLWKVKPAFMMFLGDFIYIDVPHREGSSVVEYRKAYRQMYASPDWEAAAKVRPSLKTAHNGDHYFDAHSSPLEYDLPWLHVYDDHEIANDWSAGTTGVFPAAFDPYLNYHLRPNPPLPPSAQPQIKLSADTLACDSTPTWSTFIHGPASFFLLDTRRYRNAPNKSDPYDPRCTVLGKEQFSAFTEWLETPPISGVQWKIVISSVPFTKNWRVNAIDTWSGYLHERDGLLQVMWAAQARDKAKIIVLSGDRHEFAATAFPPPLERLPGDKSATAQVSTAARLLHPATVHEFSTSPLSQFYLPVHTYNSTDVDDICIKYIPAGNSKFGIVEIDREKLTYRVVVDGKEVWSYVIEAGRKES